MEQIQFLLGHVSVHTTEKYLGCKQRLRQAVNDRLGIEPVVCLQIWSAAQMLWTDQMPEPTLPVSRAYQAQLNYGQHAAIIGLSYLKEVLDISLDWEDKETKGQP